MPSEIVLPPQVLELVKKLDEFQVHSSATETELYLTDALYVVNTLNEVCRAISRCNDVCHSKLIDIKELLTKRVIEKLSV